MPDERAYLAVRQEIWEALARGVPMPIVAFLEHPVPVRFIRAPLKAANNDNMPDCA